MVYNLLPKGVLEELQAKTPKSAAGNKTARLHQGLTLDIGEPHLEKQLGAVILLMNISDTWKEFLKHFGRKFQNSLIEIAQSNINAKPSKKFSAEQYLLFEEPKAEEQQKIPFESAPFGNLLGAVARAGKPDKENK